MGEEVSYKSMRKVHTIILFEKSSANLQSEFDENFIFTWEKQCLIQV